MLYFDDTFLDHIASVTYANFLSPPASVENSICIVKLWISNVNGGSRSDENALKKVVNGITSAETSADTVLSEYDTEHEASIPNTYNEHNHFN